MKKALISFFNSPRIVAVTALVIAAAIGILGYSRIHTAPAYQYATAGTGVISDITTGAPSMHDLTLGFVTGGKIAAVNVKVGDSVKKGAVLATIDAGNARGALTQAQAAYASAQANYNKVISGATGASIDVAKAALNTATVNLGQATDQQNVLVNNAYHNLLNSSLVPQSTAQGSTDKAPTLSGSYAKTDEGTITITAYSTGTGGYFTYSGLVNGTADINFTIPQPIADTGLSLVFPSGQMYSGATWDIVIPNTLAPNYLANKNAYDQAVQTRTQTLANAQAAIDQAEASLTALATAARPEDVAAAQAQVQSALGAVQIAEGAYSNTVITAPSDGKITSVSITAGAIAVPNAPAIELFTASTEKDVAVMIPLSAVVMRNGLSFVQKKTSSGTVETQVTLGAQDATNVEILSGLAVGDMVVTH